MFFDPTKVERDSKVEIVPAGVYTVQIQTAKRKDANGTGCMVFFQVIAGEYRGRQLMEYFNIYHSSENAQKIGQVEFCKLLDAIGMGKDIVGDPADLEGKVCVVDVATVPHYKLPGVTQNKIKSYSADKQTQQETDLPF